MSTEEQQNIIKKMTPAQKLDAALRLYYSTRQLKSAYLRSLHPGWSVEQVEAQVKEDFLYART